MASLQLSLHIAIFLCCWSAGLCNNPPFPSFGPPSGHITLVENALIGTTLFTISARDDDSNDVKIEIDTNNQQTVELVELGNLTRNGDTWSRDAILKSALDRDRNPPLRTLVFTVSDEQSSPLSGKVNLIIRDVNDNPPYFTNQPYRISLKEDTPVNRTVFTVTADDPDDGPGGSARYSMAANAQGADQDYNTTFQVDRFTGVITLKRPLDYETRTYFQFLVYAEDGGNPPCPGPECGCNNVSEPNVNCSGVPAVFSVTVIDVQDSPPVFDRLPYITSISENASVGTTVFQVSALDGDRGVPNDITYSIVEDGHPFAINNVTGDLTVAVAMDADKPGGRGHRLTVMASEVEKPNEVLLGETNATTQVSITVLDINDNSPEFHKTHYVATVQENTPKGVPLSLPTPIEVTDKDQEVNSQFTLTVMKDGNPYDVFDTLPSSSDVIHGTSTVIVRVLNSSLLDYETVKSITFQLVATERSTSEEQSSSTNVTVTLEDMNDNSPVFLDKQQREVNVTEHADNGTILAKFTATDADSGDYGTVTYSLEDDMGKFSINATTGELMVAGDIDREERASYSLVVKATDNPTGEENNRRSARLNIAVIVLDINDHAPEFSQDPPPVRVLENAFNGTSLMTLTATDRDEGDNGKVVYKVLSISSSSTTASTASLFDVDNDSGQVYVSSSLVGHAGEHNVTFAAFDSAAEPKNATLVVEFEVIDVNLNEPVFHEPDETLYNASIVPEVEVVEELPPGSYVMNISAVDDDKGDNGKVFYTLEPDLAQNFTNFRLDPESGLLTNALRLDREKHESIRITLKAADKGSPTLSKVIPLIVRLIDIDDNAPEFPQRTFRLKVGEETANVTVGYVNISTDADKNETNRIRCYYLYDGKKLDYFSLNKEDGELFLLQKLDRDVEHVVDIVVKVDRNCSLPEDHFHADDSSAYNDSDSSLLNVTIDVMDINDNPPVLDKSALTVGLLYDVEIGTSVFELAQYTKDEDTEEHSQNKFRLVGDIRISDDMPRDLLNPVPFVVSRNGSVQTNRLFQADLLGYFTLTVEAYDDDNQTDSGDLTIYLVSDAQRIKLVFDKLPNEVRGFIGNLTRDLSAALGFKVIADKVASHITSNGQPDPERTDVYIHARYVPSGEVVPTNELNSAFDYNDEVRQILRKYLVENVLPARSTMPEEEDTTMRALIIVACILGIACVALAVVLCNTVRRYHRRLRAATTSAYVSEKQGTEAYVPPGTNKYFAAENPLFGRDVKMVDPDRLSNDSLDNNAVDGARSGDEKDKEEEQEMYLQLFEEQHGPSTHINHLAMVLHEYDRELEGQPDTSPASTPLASSVGARDDNWKRSMNGHVKADSGFNEQGHVERSDDFQYTDI